MDDYWFNYSLTQYGYCFLAGCAVVLLLYIADLAERKKRMQDAEPKSAALPQ